MTDRSVVYRLRAEVTQFRAQMAQASASTQKLAGDLTGLDKNGATMRRGLTSVGNTAGKIGLVAAAGLGAAVLAAANFDQAMSNVQAATHESTANMELLRAAALKAGADTAFSATEAAAGVEELAKAGVSTADILGGGLTGALDLAAAGGLEVAQAAEISATALTQFKLAGEDVGHVADLLAAGAGKAQGSVEDMGMALKQSGLVAAQTGLTVEETTGTLAAFASAGLIGSDAGTSFKTMLQSLTPTGAKARDLMDELGISAYDAQGNFVGMTEFAGSLQNGLKDLSVEQQNAAMKTIFGSDAVRAASVVFQQGAGGIQEWIDKTNDAGYAAETAATRMDNLKGDLEQLKGSLETALIGAGDGSQSPLRSLTQNITKAVNAFNDLSDAQKNMVSSALGITALAGGGLWFGSKVINGIAHTKESIEQLGISAKTTGRALAVMKGGLALGAAVATLAAVDAMLDKIGNHDFSDVDLGRQLEALANGEIAGELGTIGSKLGLLEAESKGMTGMDKMWGWIPGVSSDAEDAASNIEKIDQALAGLVEGGDPGQAAAVFEQIQLQADEAGVSTDTLSDSFDAYKLALRNSEGPTDSWISRAFKADGATENLGQAMDQTRHSGDRLAKHMEAQAAALQQARDAAAETATSFFDLTSATDGAKATLGGWLKEMEDQADALRNFTRNAVAAGENGVKEGLIDHLRELGPEGAKQMRWLANATVKEVARANAAWARHVASIKDFSDAITGVPQLNIDIQDAEGRKRIKEIQRLVDKFGMTKAEAKAFLHDAATDKTKAIQKLIDEYGITKARATALLNDLATGDIRKVAQELRALDGDRAVVTIHTVRTSSDGVDFASGGQRKHSAMGGYISGPGTATSDSIPAQLSNGEYVVRASAVQQYGVGFFDRLNAQQFATGGPVGAAAAAPQRVSFSPATVNIRDPWGGTHSVELIARVADDRINKHQKMRGGQKGYGQ